MAIRSLLDRSGPRKPLDVAGSLGGQHMAVPRVGASIDRLADQLRLAKAIGAGPDASLHLIDPRSDRQPRVLPGDIEEDEIDEVVRTWFGEVTRSAGGRQVARAIQEYVETDPIDTVVLPARDDGMDTRISAAVECDVLTVNGGGPFREFASILVPVAGGPHSGPTVESAARIAAACDAWLDLLHVLPAAADEAEIESTEEQLSAIAAELEVTDDVTPWVLSADDAAETIVEQSAYYGLTVVGAPTSGRLKRFLYGSTSEAIREEADSLVVAVRSFDRSD